MKVEFDIASDQIDGARDYQEDAFMVSKLGENDDGDACSLMIMADGMGGHAAGNVASNMVISTFNKSFQGKFPSKNVPRSLSAALNQANQQINDSIKETPALKGMGCTMVSAYLEDDSLYWISVGDSHLYMIRDSELIKHNADHSYGAYIDLMRDQGMDIEEQPGMSRNMLMSAMTGDDISSVDCPDKPVKVKPGDRLIIASDGLDTLTSDAIIQYSSWSTSARECVYALLKGVEETNKINQDNTTIIVVDIREKAQPVEQAPPAMESLPKSISIEPEISRYQITPEKKSRSSLIWLIPLLFIGGGGYYAWQQGLLDGLISDATQQVQDIASPAESDKPVVTETIDTTPTEAVEKPEKIKPRDLVKQPKIEQPAIEKSEIKKPEIATQQPYVERANPFTDRLKVGGRSPMMIQIPAGSFRMGNTSGLISADENPKHDVTVASFFMSVNEVTYAEYDVFARATGRKRPPSKKAWDRKTHPVSDVSWDDALAYTKWLSKQTGKKYRLPSEAEWEYAARGGRSTSFWWGSRKGTGNAHCFDCGSELNTGKPAKVGSYKPNPFGLNDTAGNLLEWVHDCYHRNYNDAPGDGSVWDGGDCSVRVARGGSYRSPASSIRVENRDTFPSKKGQYNLGIRLVRDM